MGSLRAAYNLDALQKRYGLHFFCARTSIAWQCCTAPILGPSVNEHHITNSLIFYFDTARVHLMYFFFFFFLQKYNTCPQYFWGNGCTMEWGPCFSDYLCAQNPRQLNGLANIKNQTDTPNICKFPPFRPPSCIRISNIYSSTSGTKPIQIYWAVFQHPTFLSKQGSNPAAYLSTGPSAISPHKPFHMHIVCVYISTTWTSEVMHAPFVSATLTSLTLVHTPKIPTTTTTKRTLLKLNPHAAVGESHGPRRL